MKFDQKVLDALPPLASGGHVDDSAEVCAMEALARACGLDTTDHPSCASPVIGAFVRTLNDELLDDESRDRIIRPLLPLMVGTADDGHDEARIWLLADSAVRVFAAAALESAGLTAEAKTLRALEPIRDSESAARSAELAARSAARSAGAAAAEAAAVNEQAIIDVLRLICTVG